MGYTKKAITGFGWQTLLRILSYILTIAKIYFLARLLTPADFGLFSLAAITLGISEALTQTGVNLTILQSKHSVKYFLNTAWVIAIVRGFVIGTVMILLGLGMSRIFNQPQLLTLISVTAFIPVIKGFINPYIVILHKEMFFFQDALYRFSFLLVEIILSILFGFLLQSPFALAFGMIGSGLFEVAISFIFFKQKPVFQYIPSSARQIFNNTKWISVSSLLNYLSEHVDDFLIGRLTSTHDLGIYHNAYSLTHKVNYQISKSVHHGTIPIFTKITNNISRLKKAFIKSFLGTIGVIIFFSAPLLIAPELIVNLLLGPQWLGAVSLITPLVLAGIVQSLINICYTLFLATKKYKFLNLHLLAGLILMTGLIVLLGQNSGLTGAVYAILLSRVITLPAALAGAYQQLEKE